jgi:hypothetical protein
MLPPFLLFLKLPARHGNAVTSGTPNRIVSNIAKLPGLLQVRQLRLSGGLSFAVPRGCI